MYKRRKVFSKIGEKTFSTTEFKTQKEFAAKKESAKKTDGESKKEKVAKAATIGGATVGLGAGAAGLGAEIGRKKVKKGIAKAEKELVTAGGGIKARKATSEAIDKMKKADKILEKVSKKAGKAGIAGVGASVAGAIAYKALKKKKDQKEFAEKKSNKDEKKSKIAGGIAAGLGAGALVAGNKSMNTALKSKKIIDSYNMNNALHKYDKKIAAKTGTTALPFGGIAGDPEKVKKAEELSKRHRRVVQNTINKLDKKANKLGATGLVLGAASLGSAAYGLKKKKDAKKNEKK
jgi:hypothetical protein